MVYQTKRTTGSGFPDRRRGKHEKTISPRTAEHSEFEQRNPWNRYQFIPNSNIRKLFLEGDAEKREGFEKKIHESYRFPMGLFGKERYAGKTQITPLLSTRQSLCHSVSDERLLLNEPHTFRPQETKFIQNKPIRASVVKLEPITRSPTVQHPHEYDYIRYYYNHAGNILNHVLIENIKKGVQKETDMFPRFPVLVRPVYILPSAKKSTYYSAFSNSSESETQQWKPSEWHDERRQTANFNAAPQWLKYSSPSDKNPAPHDGKNVIFANPSRKTNISVYNYNENLTVPLTYVNPIERSKAFAKLRIVKSQRINAEKNQGRHFKENNFSEELSSTDYLDEASIEKIANLTAKGVSDLQSKKRIKILFRNHKNAQNFYHDRATTSNKLSNLINVFSKNLPLSSSIISRSSNVDFNDDLNLDARILKDTNWDGLTKTVPTLITIPHLRKGNVESFYMVSKEKEKNNIVNNEKKENEVAREHENLKKGKNFPKSDIFKPKESRPLPEEKNFDHVHTQKQITKADVKDAEVHIVHMASTPLHPEAKTAKNMEILSDARPMPKLLDKPLTKNKWASTQKTRTSTNVNMALFSQRSFRRRPKTSNFSSTLSKKKKSERSFDCDSQSSKANATAAKKGENLLEIAKLCTGRLTTSLEGNEKKQTKTKSSGERRRVRKKLKKVMAEDVETQ